LAERREIFVCRGRGLQFLAGIERGERFHVGFGEVRHHAHHDRALACRLFPALRFEIDQLLVKIFGKLAGDLGIGRSRAITVGSVARGADLVGDRLRSREILSLRTDARR
jgi:hypothetical protein